MSNYSMKTYCRDFARKQNTSATSSINFDVGFPAPCPAFVSIRAIKGLVYETEKYSYLTIADDSNITNFSSKIINGKYVSRLPGLSLVLARVEVVQ